MCWRWFQALRRNLVVHHFWEEFMVIFGVALEFLCDPSNNSECVHLSDSGFLCRKIEEKVKYLSLLSEISERRMCWRWFQALRRILILHNFWEEFVVIFGVALEFSCGPSNNSECVHSQWLRIVVLPHFSSIKELLMNNCSWHKALSRVGFRWGMFMGHLPCLQGCIWIFPHSFNISSLKSSEYHF